MTISRRQFLRATATATVGTVALTGPVTATPDAYLDAKPDHVSLTFDRETLDAYRPRLDLTGVETNTTDSRPSALYGWLAQSPEHDTSCAVYWSKYHFQQGLVGVDSHYGDREPIYVFIDEAGDVSEICYSAYHWLKAESTSPPLYDETHPELSVVSPWHQYATGNVTSGEFVDVAKLGDDDALADDGVTTEFESWLDNGIDESLAPGTVVNPWIMRSREHWWRETAGSFSKDAFIASLAYQLSSRLPAIDWGGAGESDSPV